MKYLKLFTDFLQDVEPLSFEERGRLITAMLIYMEDGTEPGLIGNERILWGTMKKGMDKQKETYAELCERNKKNITARYETLPESTTSYETLPEATSGMKNKNKNKNKNNKEILSKESTKKGSVPPTVEEVRAYCIERGNGINAEQFVASYQQKGWKVGKARTPMEDWKAAVRYWETTGYNDPKPKTQYRNADLERLEIQL